MTIIQYKPLYNWSNIVIIIIIRNGRYHDVYVNHEVSQSLCISVLCALCQCNYAIVRVCMCLRLICSKTRTILLSSKHLECFWLWGLSRLQQCTYYRGNLRDMTNCTELIMVHQGGKLTSANIWACDIIMISRSRTMSSSEHGEQRCACVCLHIPYNCVQTACIHVHACCCTCLEHLCVCTCIWVCVCLCMCVCAHAQTCVFLIYTYV